MIWRGLWLASCLWLFSACDQQRIEVYQTPKQNVALETAAALAPAPPVQPATWTRPGDWQEQPLSEMRLGSFKVAGPNNASADVSVTSFPGPAGGLESNLNRWRGQVQLPPLSGDDLDKTIEHRILAGVPVLLVDFASPESAAKQSRILGAIFENADRTWFVKMTGDPELVGARKTEFNQFVDSFHFSDGDTTNPALENIGRAKSTNDK
jgi:hypothetical protein